MQNLNISTVYYILSSPNRTEMAQYIYLFKLPNGGYHGFLCSPDMSFQKICEVMIEKQLINRLPLFFVNGKYVTYNATIESVNPIGPIVVLEERDCMVSFQYLTGLRLSIPVSRNTTFAEVRAMLAYIGQSPNVRFILCGQVIEDAETMESVNVFVNPVVHII